MSTPLADLQALADEFTAVRRDIHRHPELGYQEFRTSDLVALRLAQWGYQVKRGLGGTGVVGQLRRGGFSADYDPGTGKWGKQLELAEAKGARWACLLYTSPSPRDRQKSRMPSSA